MSIAAYVPLIAAFVGGGFLIYVAYLNNRFQERTRKLDLFKVIYPEKVKAAQVLMQSAALLYHKATSHAVMGDPNDQYFEKELHDAATALFSLSTSSEWILGSEVETAGRELAIMTRKLISTMRMNQRKADLTGEELNDWIPDSPELCGNGKYQFAYKKLGQAVSQQLRLATLESVLPTDKGSVQQAIVSSVPLALISASDVVHSARSL